ncbi:MAG: hypothetical protein KC931_21245 [Candidatus Omnitrophica bacterium]|nr:hypothetical protein [Candidatus Omnitrophota bacterium]
MKNSRISFAVFEWVATMITDIGCSDECPESGLSIGSQSMTSKISQEPSATPRTLELAPALFIKR